MSKARLDKFYENVVSEDFLLLYTIKNIAELPHFERAVLNTTSNSFLSDSDSVVQSFSAWLLGTTQKCVMTRARKSIALFGIRESNLLGLKVTCRKRNLFALLDKLVVWVLPFLISKVPASKPPESTKENENSRNPLEIRLKQFGLLPHSVCSERSYHLTKLGENRSLFTISNRSFLSFPEVSLLFPSFNLTPGFSLLCEIKYKNKRVEVFPYEIGFCKKSKTTIYRLSRIKNQFISAFQLPDTFIKTQ